MPHHRRALTTATLALAAALLTGGCATRANSDAVAHRLAEPNRTQPAANPAPVFVTQKVAMRRPAQTTPATTQGPLTLGAGDRLGWALFDRHLASTAPYHPAGSAYAIAQPD